MLLRKPVQKEEGLIYVSSIEEGVRFLEKTEGITLQPMNLQKVFVSLCDGEAG